MPPARITWVPPDGGWGWVIVVCSLLLHMHTVGVVQGLSVMYVSWLETFGEGRGVTSWVISISSAICYGLAPIPAALANHYGFRVVVIVGGLLTSIGFILSYFATSVTFLIVSIGLLTGLGSCFGYLSSVAIVTVYFNKKRPIAMGIATTGIAVGALVLGPIIDYLNNIYGWRGTNLILGAYSLHMCAYGLLLRPLKTVTVSDEMCIETADSYVEDEKSLLFNENDDILNVNGDVTEDSSKIPAIGINNNIDVSSMNVDHSTVRVSEYPLQTMESFLRPELTESHGNVAVYNLGHVDKVHELRNSRISMHSWQGKAFKQHSNARPYSSLKDLDNNRIRCQDSTTMLSNIKGKKSLDAIFANSVKHLDRIVLMGSLPTKMYQSIDVIENANLTKEEIDHFEFCSEYENDKNRHTFLYKINNAIVQSFHTNRDLLKDPVFSRFGISNLITNLSFITPVMYLVDRAEDEGLGKSIGAMLISLTGAGGILGRFFFGAVTYRLFQDRLLTYIFVLSLAGIFSMLSPLCGSNVYLHCIYAVLIGCFLGGYGTLVSVVTADLMGITKASVSYGLLLTFMSVGTLMGPPLAGLLFDWTRSYTVSYVLMGFFLVTSALMLIPDYYIKRRNIKRQTDLGKKNKITKRLKEKFVFPDNQSNSLS